MFHACATRFDVMGNLGTKQGQRQQQLPFFPKRWPSATCVSAKIIVVVSLRVDSKKLQQ